MKYNRGEKIAEVRRLTQEGYTQEELWEKTGVQPRTQRNWKSKGLLGFNKGHTREQGVRRPKDGEGEGEFTWPDITAADLVNSGFMPDRTPSILATLGIAREQGNDRFPRFLTSVMEARQRWPDMPDPWLAAVAGFPIIAEDIDAPSIAAVAALVRELNPYLSKESRRAYRRRAKPLLVGVLAEVQAFLTDATVAGGYPLVVMTYPPEWSKPWSFLRSPTTSEAYHIADALDKGCWTYGWAPGWEKISPERTWAGILFDIVSRLPDVDRQKGKLMKRIPLLGLVYVWCGTAAGDFKPPLPDIVRTVPQPHSIVEMYMHLRDGTWPSTAETIPCGGAESHSAGESAAD